jgi:hypothetical protein
MATVEEAPLGERDHELVPSDPLLAGDPRRKATEGSVVHHDRKPRERGRAEHDRSERHEP